MPEVGIEPTRKALQTSALPLSYSSLPINPSLLILSDSLVDLSLFHVEGSFLSEEELISFQL